MGSSDFDVEIIEDPGDPRFKQFRVNERALASRAQKRDDTGAGLFLAEGDLVVERAFRAGCVPTAALVDTKRIPDIAGELDCVLYGGGPAIRTLVAKMGFPLSILALFERPARPSARGLATSARRLVVAEAVDNPVNVGSIVRNAAALGWDGLILDHTSADPLSRRSLRVAMGTAFSLPHARTQHLAAELLALSEFELYALTPDPTARLLDTVQAGSRAAILVGSERSGLSKELVDLSIPVRIPMAAGVDSLNAAAATAVACWALRA